MSQRQLRPLHLAWVLLAALGCRGSPNPPTPAPDAAPSAAAPSAAPPPSAAEPSDEQDYYRSVVGTDAGSWALCGVCNKTPPPAPRTASALSAADERAILGEADLGGIERWRARLSPLFSEPTAEMKKKAADHEEWIAEAQVLPDPEAALRQRLPEADVTEQREQAVAWLRTLLRPGWLDGRGVAQLLALPGGLSKQDAFFGGWVAGGRPIQIVETEASVYVRTTHESACGDSPREKLAAALALAEQLFNLPGRPCDTYWAVWSFGPIAAGIMSGMETRQWYQTLGIVTDGASVKYRFAKVAPRPTLGHGPPRAAAPSWFGRR